MDEIYTIPDDTLFPTLYKKKQVTYTVNEGILKEFNEVAEAYKMYKSGVIEEFMKIFIKNMNTKK